ncbi:hypothetical protein QQ045_007308 [Rhodiola kirilowii]
MDHFNFYEGFEWYQQRRREMNARANFVMMMNAAIVATTGELDDDPVRRQPNREIQRGPRGQNLLDDYFINYPIFPKGDFRPRYRMSSNLFNRLKTKLYNHDVYWHQRCDAIGVLGLLPEQKMTGDI